MEPLPKKSNRSSLITLIFETNMPTLSKFFSYEDKANLKLGTLLLKQSIEVHIITSLQPLSGATSRCR